MTQTWDEESIAYLVANYADMSAADVAKAIGRSVGSVWCMASRLGLRKSREFLSQQGRIAAACENAMAHRFQKGIVPHNKGKRIEDFMSPEGIENSKRTRFVKGQLPHNTREVGTERVHQDGYVYLRIDDGCIPKHRYVWEQHYGAIPEGAIVTFKDGNPQNCDIANLELIRREDAARRTISRETAEARQQRISKATEVRNKNIRRDKIRLHFGLEPYGKIVKRW